MRQLLAWFISILSIGLTYGQTLPEYDMSNAKVTDCSGILRDSENGTKQGEYDHNEDFTFTICVQGGASITMVFDSFCTEIVEDYLEIYAGPDTTYPMVGSRHSGTTSPGTVVANSSCVTFYFHSDKSVTCTGFKLTWSTIVDPLPQPHFVWSPDVSCDDAVIGVKLDQKFNCDSINAASFGLTGPINQSISSVKAVNCDGNNETDTFSVSLNGGLDRSGNYQLSFNAIKYDACDSPWMLQADTTFVIDDCPIDVELVVDSDTVCRGSCTNLTAKVTGGDSSKYVFTWNNGITGTFGPHVICPTVTTDYILTVSDGVALPDTDTIRVVVIDPPTTMPDTSICLSSPAFALTSAPSGGTWSGKGISNPASSTYRPIRAGVGRDTVVYSYATCTDTMIITVLNMTAGRPNAACPFSAPFNVFDFAPAGGKWSGPNIDSNGVFTPGDTGTFTVTYTWNGCTDTKNINVYPISVPATDTFCLSLASAVLQSTPAGGRWSGPGITDPLSGIFYPPSAGAGNKRLIYTANGCSDTTDVFVISINARGNEVACPDEAPFNVLRATPVGGYWTGVGITDSLTGAYNPNFIYGLNRTWYNDTLRYYLNGCVDEKIVYIRQTSVGVDTVKFCIEDPRLFLNWASVRVTPGGGVWTGNGITGNYFYPDRAGHGLHLLYYTANNCYDSMYMLVHPAVDIQTDTNFCITEPPYNLRNNENAGFWAGKGITNASAGTFNPRIAGVGSHRIHYYSKFGCHDSLLIDVYGLPNVKITSFDPFYCLKDSAFSIAVNPLGGTFSGTGISGTTFNPRTAGTGKHKIYYQFGRPTCFSTDSAVLTVIDTLKTRSLANSDTICEGEDIVFTSLPSGGTGNFTISWHSGESGSSIIKGPSTDTWIWSEVRDGCSDVYRDSLFIKVHPEVHANVITSGIKCYGLAGFAEVITEDNEPYEVTWFTSPQRKGLRINAPVASRYNFQMVNTRTGCTFDSFAVIPGYNRINAYFVTSPREGYCLNPFDPILNFINQSVGATGGLWDFGDGQTEPYDPLVNPQHVYSADTNRYTIKLVIWNEGGCSDSLTAEVCLDDSVYVLMPNAFSPNNDGINDFLNIPTAGVEEFELLIFNRWGEFVFQTSDKNVSWDGTYLGEPVQKGAYAYYLKFKGKKTTKRQMRGVLIIL